MKHVGGGRVVHNDDFVQLPTQPTEVLDIIATMKHTRLAEKPTSKHVPFIKKVRHRIRVLKLNIEMMFDKRFNDV